MVKNRYQQKLEDTLLHGQLQEGLSDVLIRAPAVLGELMYQELCVATENERQKVLVRRKHQHHKDKNATPLSGTSTHKNV